MSAPALISSAAASILPLLTAFDSGVPAGGEKSTSAPCARSSRILATFPDRAAVIKSGLRFAEPFFAINRAFSSILRRSFDGSIQIRLQGGVRKFTEKGEWRGKREKS